MIADCHLHTEFSTDSTERMETQVQQALALGMKHVCITDHMDFDFPTGEFCFDTDSYVHKVFSLREKYREQIYVALGVELGMQAHLKERIDEYLQKYPFDFTIGSLHLLHGEDPYHGKIFERMGDEETYREYFRETGRILRECPDVDTLGHLDYVVRYGKTKAQNYSYHDYAEEIDAILHLLIERGIALEVNTAGFRSLGFTNPHTDIIRRYRQLGGEMITIGSDGHKREHVGYGFEKLKEQLRACGFTHYTIFKERKPFFEPIC